MGLSTSIFWWGRCQNRFPADCFMQSQLESLGLDTMVIDIPLIVFIWVIMTACFSVWLSLTRNRQANFWLCLTRNRQANISTTESNMSVQWQHQRQRIRIGLREQQNRGKQDGRGADAPIWKRPTSQSGGPEHSKS
jgi:hypothetical protein